MTTTYTPAEAFPPGEYRPRGGHTPPGVIRPQEQRLAGLILESFHLIAPKRTLAKLE